MQKKEAWMCVLFGTSDIFGGAFLSIAFKVCKSSHKQNVLTIKMFCFYNLKKNLFKGTVGPDWICMRVIPLDRPLWGLINMLELWLYVL